MTDFKIEQGIPVPLGDARSRYPFQSMNVGDSFALTPQQVRSARNSMHAYAKRSGTRFTLREVGDGVWRCWRIS